MVPARFVWSEALPRTLGGKVARSELPEVAVAAVAESFAGDGSVRSLVRRAFGVALGTPSAELGDDDDFFANGGNSLRAAMLVSELRGHAACADVAVRDVYRAPTVRGLLEQLGRRSGGRGAERAPDRALHASSAGSLWCFSLVQAAVLAAGFFVGATALWLGVVVLLDWLLSLSLVAILFFAPLAPAAARAAWAVASVSLAVLAKRLLIGAYRPCRVPAWSGARLRHWIVARLAQVIPWGLIEGTELQSTVLRLLGARIGRRVHFHRGVALYDGGWDLLEIGDDVSLGRDVELGMCELDDGELVVGPVKIGARATLEGRAGVGPDTVVGADAVVRGRGLLDLHVAGRARPPHVRGGPLAAGCADLALARALL
jgi:serine acetyltransferase